MILAASLLEHRPAGFAEAGLPPPQAAPVAAVRPL
jgi:hypothetical protein